MNQEEQLERAACYYWAFMKIHAEQPHKTNLGYRAREWLDEYRKISGLPVVQALNSIYKRVIK